jgi:hypothetical protein
MRYNDVVEELGKTNCFVFSKKRTESYYSESNIFFIRGTRYLCIVKKVINFNGNYTNPEERTETAKIEWFFKTKKFKNKYKQVSFEEILESKLVSNKAKSEILFHLDLFRS